MRLKMVAVPFLVCMFFMVFAFSAAAADLPLDKITTGSEPDSVIYKTVGDYELQLYVFYPQGFQAGDYI